MMSKPSARGFAATALNINRDTITDCFRLTKVEQPVLYEDNLPYFVRDFFGGMGDIPIYERIIHMS